MFVYTQHKSVISFSEMSKDVLVRVCEANSVSKNHEVIFTAIFEITKEGRKHTGISSAVCEEERLKRVPVLLLG